MIRWIIVGLSALMIAGCQSKSFPDPNDPNIAGKEAPERLLANLRQVSDQANRRVRRGELTEEQAAKIVSDKARELASGLDVKNIPPTQAWMYGDLYRSGRLWEQAEGALLIAVKAAKTEDRRVVDSLRLAQAQAQLGKLKQAIKSAGTVMNAKPVDCAPILPGVLFEVVPAAEGSNVDAELAGLLEKAIEAHARTIVDEKSTGGVTFLLARSRHIDDAWEKVIELYSRAGDTEKAAIARAQQTRFRSSIRRA